MLDVLKLATDLQDWSIKHRRYLHQHPELSLEEHNTSNYCKEVLEKLGYQITPIWETGFIADLKLGFDKTIAFRADMDALPIHEDENSEFASKTPGVSHVCGHDAHMTIALTNARILKEQQKHLKTNIRFIFQPSEEVSPGGAISMIKHGCLKNVDEIYGLHNDPKTKVGKIKCLEGAMTASCDMFHVVITGKGGHAASPHLTLDPLYIGASLVTEINQIISRRISPMHPAVLSITYFKGGEVQNAIPDQIEFGGVIRTFDKDDRNLINKLVNDLIKSKEILGYKTEINFTESYPSIINEKYGQERVLAAARAVIKPENVLYTGHPEAWGEDFAYYLQEIPGSFFILGSGSVIAKKSEPLHSPRFNFDEYGLVVGSAVTAQIALGLGEF